MRRVFRKISSILKFHKTSPEEKLRKECEVRGGGRNRCLFEDTKMAQ